MYRYQFILATALLSTFGLLSGCNTTTGIVAEELIDEPSADLKMGSPVADLMAALGEPDKIEPAKDSPEPIDVWIYKFSKTWTEMVTTDTVEIPFWDPITGEMESIEEPVFSPQKTIKEDTVRVFVKDGVVLGWKVDQAEERDIFH